MGKENNDKARLIGNSDMQSSAIHIDALDLPVVSLEGIYGYFSSSWNEDLNIIVLQI